MTLVKKGVGVRKKTKFGYKNKNDILLGGRGSITNVISCLFLILTLLYQFNISRQLESMVHMCTNLGQHQGIVPRIKIMDMTYQYYQINILSLIGSH